MRVYYDLHLHTCLSPCGDNDMTPWNTVNMAKLLGLDMIAVTDHNSCKNCRSAIRVGEKTGITVVPGMELCTSEEVHCICLFDDIDRAEAFSELVKSKMPPIKNREKIFGTQLIMDDADGILGKEELLLTAASSISIDALPELVKEYGGVCLPAHIDRQSFSILSSLGDFPPGLKVGAFELTPMADEKYYYENYGFLKGKALLRGSDAHYLENMREKEFYVEIEENSVKAFIDYIKRSYS
jgi:PHP family Zn ribbon phosphoesterase